MDTGHRAQLKTLSREELTALPEGLEAERVVGPHLEATEVYLSPTSRPRGERRLGGTGFRGNLHLPVAGQGADAERVVLAFHERQLGEPVHVDQRANVGHAQVEQRHEALPLGREVWLPPSLGREGQALSRPSAGRRK